MLTSSSREHRLACAHFRDVLHTEPTHEIDAHRLRVTRGRVFRAHGESAVCIEHERHVDLHIATPTRTKTGELDLTKPRVLAEHSRLALADLRAHDDLVVLARREHARLLDGNGRVASDDLLAEAAH